MLNSDEIYKTVLTAGEEWADKKAAYETLDDCSKSVLADLTTDYLPPACASKSEAETRALASKQYKEHLASKSAARRAWLVAEVRYKGLVMLAELRRSEESTRRQEMKL